jgi:hypothetical protein
MGNTSPFLIVAALIWSLARRAAGRVLLGERLSPLAVLGLAVDSTGC